MVRTLSIKTEIPPDHKVKITLPDDLPVGPVEITLTIKDVDRKPISTLGDLAESEFFGMWKDRTDIEDSLDFARRLREKAWRRSA